MARNQLPSGANAGGGAGGGAVTSVAGRTGDVTLAVADVSGAAPLASPTLTGTPAAPTAAQGTNTTQLATTAMVHSEVVLLATLASPTFTGTVVLPTGTVTSGMILDGTIAGGDLSSTIAIPSAATATTQTAADNSTKIATTAYVDAKERTFAIGKGGAIGATETNAADFPFCAPYALTMKRMKVTLGTACSGAMTVQLRKAAGPITTPPSYSDVANFVVTFSSGNVLAVVDPADLTLAEGDFVNFSCATGSGANLMVEVICI